MATRANPFYRYNNPAMGAAFGGIAEAMFPSMNKTQAEIMAKEAQAGASNAQAQASYALAAERGETTRGKRIKNERYDASPTDLADLFLSGGRVQDDPFMVNPNWQPPAPMDFSLLAPTPAEPMEPMILSRTATDKLASAIQQMEAYGFRPDQIMDAIGGLQFLQRAGGADPQSALPFAPFAGVTNPGAGTALSPTAQNRISARDAAEAKDQATAVEGMRSQNRLEIEGIREEGRNNRGTGRTGTGGSAASVPTVNAPTAKAIREALVNRVDQLGYDEVEPQAIDTLVSLASRIFQDRTSDGFKNVAVSVQEAMDMLEAGTAPDLAEVLDEGFFSDSRRLTRQPGANAQPPDISKLSGVPQGSRTGKKTPQGWEVFDANGNLIGHVQQE